MPAEMMEVEVFVIVDENGDYSVGADGDTAAERTRKTSAPTTRPASGS